MEQFGSVSCHHHSFIWHNKQNKTNAHLHVSIFLAEFSGLYFFLCLCLSVAHFFVQWFSLFFFCLHIYFHICCLFLFLFVCVSHTGDAEIKPRQGGIRYKTYLYQPCHVCCCYLNKKKNWSIHEVPHSSSGKCLHPWHGQLFFSTWDCHVLSCLSK